MNRAKRSVGHFLAAACLVGLAVLLPGTACGADIQYDGTFTLQPNGDALVLVKLTLPMQQYQALRDNVSNLYVLLRDLASSRADTEVVDKKADWDDANRVVTFSMKVLGAVRNLGDHWELDVEKGPIFSNLDEAKRTLFFNETQETPMGTIRGTSKLVLPEKAKKFSWDEAKRVATYAMPRAKKAQARSSALWIVGLVLIVLGGALTAVSFVVEPPPAAGQKPAGEEGKPS